MSGVPLVLRLALSLVLVAGIVTAGYLVWHHDNLLYGDATAHLSNCAHTETVDCDAVNTSAWSELFGVPIAAYAVPTYLLVLLMTWSDRSRPGMLAAAFCIGLAATGVSAFLLYISKVKIGLLCLWCMRLYAVNLSIPILAAFAARRSPTTLVGETGRQLRTWPRPLRHATLGFVLVLGVTVLVQHEYRSWLEARTAREVDRILKSGGPLESAVPKEGAAAPRGRSAAHPDDDDAEPPSGSSGSDAAPGAPNGTAPPPSTAPGPGSSRLNSGSAEPEVSGLGLDLADLILGATPAEAATPPEAGGSPAPAGKPDSAASDEDSEGSAQAPGAASPGAPSGPIAFPTTLRRVSGSNAGIKSEPFDLKAKLGKGKAVALLFWAPGFLASQRSLVEWSDFIHRNVPGLEVYAVSGRRIDQKDEEVWESFAMMDLPAELPLVVDDGFLLSEAMQTSDVPNVALFDRTGGLVVSRLKDPQQMVVTPDGNVRGDELLRRVAAAPKFATIQQQFVYYPGSELYGHCAPAFRLKKFNTSDFFTFTGRSPAGRPTLVMFWSSTCKHCQVEVPNLVAWLKEHPGVVDVVSVTHIRSDKPGKPSHRTITQDYIKSQGIDWTVLEDPDGAVEDLYRSISTPTTFFVAPDGTVKNAWYYTHRTGFAEAIQKELAAITPSAAACTSLPPPLPERMDFTALGTDGGRVDLTKLVDRPTLVHFWATWCKPCKEELPELIRFRDRVEKEGTARVVFVSVEDENAGPAIQKLQKELGADLKAYRAPKGGLADKVDFAYRIPRSYFLAPGGAVAGSRNSSQHWDDPAVADRVLSRLINTGEGLPAVQPAAEKPPTPAPKATKTPKDSKPAADSKPAEDSKPASAVTPPPVKGTNGR